jgi:hypothetical protein
VKKLGCVVVLGGLALYLLCSLAPGLVHQLQASPIGNLFANPLKVDSVQLPAAQAQHGRQVSTGGDSVLGSPTIPAGLIDRVLSDYGSPAAGTGQSLYDLGVESGIDPVWALAFFMHEDSFGTTGIGAANHSLGNIRCSVGYTCQDGFRSYATWEESYHDWYDLILNGYVHGSITRWIVGHACTTIEQIIPVYAPSSDGNDVQGYIAAVLKAARTWRAGSIFV